MPSPLPPLRSCLDPHLHSPKRGLSRVPKTEVGQKQESLPRPLSLDVWAALDTVGHSPSETPFVLIFWNTASFFSVPMPVPFQSPLLASIFLTGGNQASVFGLFPSLSTLQLHEVISGPIALNAMYKLRMPKCLPVQTSPWKLDSPNYFEINTPKMKLLTQAPLQASSSHQTFSSHEAGALVHQALTHNLWRRPCLLRLTCRIRCICASFQQHLRELCRGGHYCLLVLPRQGRPLLLLKSVVPSPLA